MDRRNFFKIIGVTSAGAITEACGPDTNALIPMLVPEGQIVPGVEQWHPAVCGECAAGCGTIVRLMEGRRVIEAAVIPVETEGADPDAPAEVVEDPAGQVERVRQRVAAVKKIEGNPLDPISGGHLCARGQAVVQSLYNPDRLQAPQQLTGARGSGEFADTTWDEVIAAAAERIGAVAPENVVVLTGAQAGTRSAAWARFTEALGAPPPVVCAIDGHAVEREAARRVFGWDGLPIYDIAEATSVLNVGADFLGGWVSPVYYARKYGEFRQGRPEIRGTLVSAESRLSTTASAADRWLPVRPGTEAQFAAAVGAMLLADNLAPNRDAVPAEVIASFEAVNIVASLEACGLEVRRVREVVERWAGSLKPLMMGGASVTHSNSVDAVAATHYINLMLGNIGQPGGVLAPGEAVTGPASDHHVREALQRAQVILIDNANPAYTLPLSAGFIGALQRAPTVISFSSFLDDTAAMADIILPAHHYLEAETAIAPSLSKGPSLAVNTPFIRPLYDTRPVEQTIANLAGALELSYQNPTVQELATVLVTEELPYNEIARQGGAWQEIAPEAGATSVIANTLNLSAADADGDAGTFPLQFQPYLSIKFHDGRGANLPWMQELPDPVSSTMWELPVEIDPRTAEQLGIRDGDRVEITSAHGMLEAPAYVHPGAIPGVVSMAIGDGHTQYGRYASGRGANPLSILAPMFEASTGALVMGGTRVNVGRIGEGILTQYSFHSNEHRNIER